MALHTGEHLIGVAAGRIRVGAALTDGAGLGGEHHDILHVRLQNCKRLPRNRFVRRAGGQRLVQVGNVRHLGQRGQVERLRIGQAARAAVLHRSHRRRARPRLAVHRAFLLADTADARGERQIFCLNPSILRQRQRCKLLLDQFSIHSGSPQRNLLRIVYTICPGASMQKGAAAQRKNAPGAVCGTPDAFSPALARRPKV